MMFTYFSKHRKRIAWTLLFVMYSNLVSASVINNMTVSPAAYYPQAWHSFKKAGYPSPLSNYRAFPVTGENKAGFVKAIQSASVSSLFMPAGISKKTIRPNQSPVSEVFASLAAVEKKKPFLGGPGQPEMQAFTSVNTNNMVDLFSGDFSYNIPLMDVGGYPIGLSYRGGITMDQEASWVGLGWNINPGTIMRNVRGLPDDFNGTEQITKEYSVLPNWTAGITGMANPEIFGRDIPKISAHIGFFYNRYNGIGFDIGAGATFGFGKKYLQGDKANSDDTKKFDTSYMSKFSPSLNFSLNSQQGIGLGGSLMYREGKYRQFADYGGTIGTSWNSRSGLKDISISGQKYGYYITKGNSTFGSSSTSTDAINISFARPSYNPTINIPYTTLDFSLTLKGGGELFGFHPLGSLRGHFNSQYIAKDDRTIKLPAYGYMHYTKSKWDENALLDFNREKDIPYRKQTPHSAIPIYTYDVYSISGEGIGGNFRPYRGDAGYVHDNKMRTKSVSGGAEVDLGVGNIAHVGGSLNFNYAFVENSAWEENNLFNSKAAFAETDSNFESVYFRNPGEQAINTQEFYDQIGGDDVVRVSLSGNNFNPIATRRFQRFNKNTYKGTLDISDRIVKTKRDKRTQVITYLTAAEAQKNGLDTLIKSYPVNVFPAGKCDSSFEKIARSDGSGGVRKPHHISEISVLNSDGRRYVYGIPAYNLSQKEVTFAVNKNNGNPSTGLVSYSPGWDNSVDNPNGKDHYFNRETTPAYAHSYLLTALMSPDYMDITGDGITEDDNGDAVKFNYTRMKWNTDILNSTAYKWRMPYEANMASYNEGLRTDKTDDKGTYLYGEKEIWYLNSIESKTMIATFVLDDSIRGDNYGVIDENGGKDTRLSLKRLKKINLYSKSDYYKNPVKARPVKTVNFEYSYQLCAGTPSSDAGKGKLVLTKVWFSYNGNNRGQKNPYRFYYSAVNPGYDNKSSDRWGTYKPVTDNPNNIPNTDYPYSVQDKNKADANAIAWTMDSLSLPSGAKIKVTYESDDYAFVQNKRAMNMFKIAGFSADANVSNAKPLLYESVIASRNTNDYRYVFINVPSPVTTRDDVFRKYLEGIEKINFRLNVQMPADALGSGYETVPFFGEYEDYGVAGPNKIWIRLKEFGRDQSFPAIAALQYLRLNLPSKAYPGSDVSQDAGPKAVLKALLGMVRQALEAINGYSKSKRMLGECRRIDTTRSYLRLNNPDYFKYGGGVRVKKIVITDNWKDMTGQTQSFYGQEYDYTTTKEINYDSSGFLKSKVIRISSGVASYEPGVGREENPHILPIEFEEKITLAPTNYLSSEYPYCETFYPSASVGYSKVTVNSINKRNLKSFNGWEQSEFFTTADFPTQYDYTTFDGDSRKFAKRKLTMWNSTSLRRTTLSQGFKVELNDMNGRMKSQKSYAANDSLRPVAYTIYHYRTTKTNSNGVLLNNTVPVVHGASGEINPSGTVGKDIELMTDSRQQRSFSSGAQFSTNVDNFMVGIFPVIVPSFLPRFDISEDIYRSIVTLKVVNRYGIVDSVLHYEKGSLVSTQNVLYDAETGAVLLSRTQNEFNDPIFNFNYPAHWAYSGMQPAYKNIGASFAGLSIDGGKIALSPLYGDVNEYLESGDELLVSGNNSGPFCSGNEANWSKSAGVTKLWVVDINKATGTAGRNLYLMDRFGNPYYGGNVSIKIIRSGKRNLTDASVGSLTSLREPINRISGTQWQLKIDSTIGVVATGAGVYKDFWKVDNRFVSEYRCDTVVKTDSNTLYPTGRAMQKISQYTGDSYTDNIIGNTGYVTASFEYLHYRTSGNNSCRRTSGKNCDNSTHSRKFTTRGLLKFDGLLNLPADAVIDSARLNLYHSRPVNLWSHCNYWSNPTYSHAYFIDGGHTETNTGFIKRVTGYWDNNSINLGSSYFTETNRVTLAAAQNSDIDYAVGCKNLIQDYVNNRTSSYGLILTQALEDEGSCSGTDRNKDQRRHLSFCSGYTGTSTKYQSLSCGQPYLFVKYHYTIVSCKDTCVSIFGRRMNPYVQGMYGNWRMNTSYTFFDARKESDPAVATNIRRDGEFKKFVPYWSLGAEQLTQGNYVRWVWNSEITEFNKRGLETENKDPLGRFNSGIYGYNQTLPIAVAQNAKRRQIAFEGFEDYAYKNDSCDQRCPPERHFDFSFYQNRIDSTQRHTGKSSLKLLQGETDSLTFTVVSKTADTLAPSLNVITTAQMACTRLDSIKVNSNVITTVFSPIQGDSMVIGAWVKEVKLSPECKYDSYIFNQLQLVQLNSTGGILSTVVLKPSGNIIEGWQRYEAVVQVAATAANLRLKLQNTSTAGVNAANVFFDDIRLHPFNSNMKSFVYNPINLRLMAELDENNYASFYEYDDEGTLARVKKETQKGVKTIQETRSVMVKQQ